MCEERHAMGAARQPVCGADACAVDADKTPNSRTLKDKKNCAMDSPLPPHGHDDNDADKTARSRTTLARVFLANRIVWEVSATLWAFRQAVSAGALTGDVDCGSDGRRAKIFSSSRVADKCDEHIHIDAFYPFSGAAAARYSSNKWEGYVGCDSLIDVPTARDAFGKPCSCSSCYEGWGDQPCLCVALSHTTGDGICYAQGVFTNSSNGDIHGTVLDHGVSECWPTNPSGTVARTITALVVALSSQLLEACVCFKYWQDTTTTNCPYPWCVHFEALGVIAVSSVLLSLPGFYSVSNDTCDPLPGCIWLAWTIVTIVVVGCLAETMAECSDRAPWVTPLSRCG